MAFWRREYNSRPSHEYDSTVLSAICMSSDQREIHGANHCQMRPIENNILAIDPRRLREIDPEIVKKLGYTVHRPFIGYVDGLNPLRGAKRMVEWLQKPLDPSPPTFAHVEDEASSSEVETVKSRL